MSKLTPEDQYRAVLAEIMTLANEALDEDAPVPIYAALVDHGPAMAYGVPPVYRPNASIKRWNQDHGRHPYRDDDLVGRLRSIVPTDDDLADVLDVLSSVCCACWYDRDDCRCGNKLGGKA